MVTNLQLEGLRCETLEPLDRYHVFYEDGELLALDLEYTGRGEPHEAGTGHGVGHLDQPWCVVGEVVLAAGS